nr:protein amnionless isoform X5 [Columba livia]
MKHLFFLLGVLQLLAATAAVYKQWIPNTNFETASNWDKGRVPCASDVVHFEKNKVISVFVRSPHVLTDMYLPLNGEYVLASGAGFAAFDGSWDPGCDSGVTVRFVNAEDHAWFDPTLWQVVSPGRELEPSGRIFSVDEERVPCRYDDVIFQPQTSFRVNIDSSQQVIHLRSISLMGQEFSSPEAWAEYLRGPSAPLQFHGNGTLQVTGTGCPDKSGCVCGNTLDGHRICTALLRASGRQCPALTCQSPLQPLGHCCGVCGEALGISNGKMEVATGSTFSGQVESHELSRTTAGTVFGLLFGLLLLGGILFLYKKGKLRSLPRLLTLHIPRPWDRAEDPASPEPAGDKGFDNPMFDVEPPSADPGEEMPQEMAPKDYQVFYINPLYDASETET